MQSHVMNYYTITFKYSQNSLNVVKAFIRNWDRSHLKTILIWLLNCNWSACRDQSIC